MFKSVITTMKAKITMEMLITKEKSALHNFVIAVAIWTNVTLLFYKQPSDVDNYTLLSCGCNIRSI